MLALDVSVDRRDHPVAVALEVGPGERVALFGPSGAGKTTVLETIAGLVPGVSGRVELGDRVLTDSGSRRSVPVWQRRVGLLRQDAALFPHLDVAANLAYGGARREIREIAGRLGLGGLLGSYPAALSGGQAQRVALARLLAADADALLLDEPYRGLDGRLRRLVTELLVEAVESRQIPALLVAHELTEAQAFAHRLGVLDAGELLQLGPPHEVVLRPTSTRVAELVGYRAFVTDPRGELVGVHPSRVVAGAHPDAGVVLEGEVTAVRAAGAGFELDVATGGTVVACELDAPATGHVTVTALDPPRFDRVTRARLDRRR